MKESPRPDFIFPHFIVVGAMKAVFYRDERLYHRLAKFAAHRRPGYPPMETALREKLAQYYAPHNEALATLTHLNLSHWGSPSPTGKP